MVQASWIRFQGPEFEVLNLGFQRPRFWLHRFLGHDSRFMNAASITAHGFRGNSLEFAVLIP